MKDQVDMLASLPSGWKTLTIGEAATVVNGGTPKSKVAEYWDGEVQWLTPKDMGKMEGREISETPRTISPSGLAKSSARQVPPQSVILSTRAPIGHLAINSVPMAFNQGCRGIIPGSEVDHVYLYYFLAANREKLDGLGSGTTFKELSATNLKSVSLPLPPLEEQKRIVAVLDQAFAALDRARAHAEANLADAEELFGSSLAAAFFAEGEVPTKPLGSLCGFEGGSQPPKSQFVDTPRPGYIRLLQIRDFKSDAKAVYIPDDGRRRRCTAEDIMIGRYGASVGQIHRGKAGTYNVALIKTIPDQGELDRDYFYYYLLSDLFQKPLLAKSSRGAQDGFNKADISPFGVPVPSIMDQQRIVERLSSVEREVSTLTTQYEEKLSDIADLRQSLLQKAFSGQLIA